MTNEELLAKIKAEIERLYGKYEPKYHETRLPYVEGLLDGFDLIEQFLDTLESEKPMNQDEELNEEIKKEMVKLPVFIRGKDQIAFARHFAQWGVEHAREQMMKDPVEGKIIFLLNGDVAINIGDMDEYKLGDKVRIIIVKE